MQFRDYFLGLFLVLLIVGCQTTSSRQPNLAGEFPEPEKKGVYHKVKPGETLWRIAKTYDISLNDIIKINRLLDASKIEKDQMIFIPGAEMTRDVLVEKEAAKDDFTWPLEGKILKFFHQRIGNRVNKGIYIKGTPGSFVKASRSGRVVFADYLTGYGYTVILDHMDGLHSIYAKNVKLLVKTGDYAIKKNNIALLGHTKGNDQCFLHFEIRKKAKEENPLYYLP